MRLDIRPFQASDIVRLRENMAALEQILEAVPSRSFAALENVGLAWSAFIGDERKEIIGAGGIHPCWKTNTHGRAIAWVLAGDNVPMRCWPALTRHTAWVLDQAFREGFHRIEANVAENFPAGHRWAARLGFSVEGMAEAYGPDLANHIQYARVRHDRH